MPNRPNARWWLLLSILIQLLRGRRFQQRGCPGGQCDVVAASNGSGPSTWVAASVARSSDIGTSVERRPPSPGMHGPSGPVDQRPDRQVYPTEGSDQPSQNGRSFTGSQGQPSAGLLQSFEHPDGRQRINRLVNRHQAPTILVIAAEHTSVYAWSSLARHMRDAVDLRG